MQIRSGAQPHGIYCMPLCWYWMRKHFTVETLVNRPHYLRILPWVVLYFSGLMHSNPFQSKPVVSD